MRQLPYVPIVLNAHDLEEKRFLSLSCRLTHGAHSEVEVEAVELVLGLGQVLLYLKVFNVMKKTVCSAAAAACVRVSCMFVCI